MTRLSKAEELTRTSECLKLLNAGLSVREIRAKTGMSQRKICELRQSLHINVNSYQPKERIIQVIEDNLIHLANYQNKTVSKIASETLVKFDNLALRKRNSISSKPY